MKVYDPLTGYRYSRDLVGPTDARPFRFAEHTLAPHHATPFRSHPSDYRTFIVVHGPVILEWVQPGGSHRTKSFERFDGWHSPPRSRYRVIGGEAEEVSFVEAGTTAGVTSEAIDPRSLPRQSAPQDCTRVSSYTVDKPWGHEIWYTEGLDNPAYAVKQIHMTEGHQSSLQSHERKRETNYVVEGQATVLDGLTAPADTAAQIPIDRLTTTLHPAGSGWSSPPRELHRVIAGSTYTAIEVSTPELDDVIRWQDDTDRAHGRIAAEHAGGRS